MYSVIFTVLLKARECRADNGCESCRRGNDEFQSLRGVEPDEVCKFSFAEIKLGEVSGKNYVLDAAGSRSEDRDHTDRLKDRKSVV